MKLWNITLNGHRYNSVCIKRFTKYRLMKSNLNLSEYFKFRKKYCSHIISEKKRTFSRNCGFLIPKHGISEQNDSSIVCIL